MLHFSYTASLRAPQHFPLCSSLFVVQLGLRVSAENKVMLLTHLQESNCAPRRQQITEDWTENKEQEEKIICQSVYRACQCWREIHIPSTDRSHKPGWHTCVFTWSHMMHVWASDHKIQREFSNWLSSWPKYSSCIQQLVIKVWLTLHVVMSMAHQVINCNSPHMCMNS